MKLLLHACCGPCLLEPGRIFSEEIGDGCAVSESGGAFDVFYYNPNIHPEDEYHTRADICGDYALSQTWGFMESDYDPERWEREVGVYREDREKRCRACYRLRFEELSRVACEHGYDAISTTLSVSPYQNQTALKEELERAAKPGGLAVAYRDFSEHYPEASRRAREMGMYRQNYCGCRFSKIEAEQERAERHEARRKAKQIKRSAETDGASS